MSEIAAAEFGDGYPATVGRIAAVYGGAAV
jgi:hypothetical protein